VQQQVDAARQATTPPARKGSSARQSIARRTAQALKDWMAMLLMSSTVTTRTGSSRIRGSSIAAQIGEKVKPAMLDAVAAARTASSATTLAPAANRSNAPSARA
jgi:hypothetical protein